MIEPFEAWRLPPLKPARLEPGDRVAAVSPCWGGPSVFPYRYQAGKDYLEQTFDLDVVEMPHACKPAAWIENNPKARADDLHQAFDDPTIKGVITTIGGDDAIRLIPHLDLSLIARNPKVFLGYSDVTVLHFGCLKAGMSSFYGPSVMAGFAENCGMHAFAEASVRQMIFDGTNPVGDVPSNDQGWTAERLDWADQGNQARRRALTPPRGPRVLQGEGRKRGRLIGGCAETLEMLKGSDWWPPFDVWDDALLFYETSEEGPPPSHVLRWLRNFGAQGILPRLAGFLFGRPGGQICTSTHALYEAVILQALAEAGATGIAVMVDMDFGHTDPMMTLPYGVMAEIDCDRAVMRIDEATVG